MKCFQGSYNIKAYIQHVLPLITSVLTEGLMVSSILKVGEGGKFNIKYNIYKCTDSRW